MKKITVDRKHRIAENITVSDVPANKSSASQREDEIRFALAPTKMHICNAVDHKIPFPLRPNYFHQQEYVVKMT